MDGRGSIQKIGKHLMKMSATIFLKSYISGVDKCLKETPFNFKFSTDEIDENEGLLKILQETQNQNQK